MISKKVTNRIFLPAFAAMLMITCSCINDPSNKGWEPEGEFITRNNIPPLYKILCDKKGRYYGLTSHYVISFDKIVLDANDAPDTLPDSYKARDIRFDRNHDLIVLQESNVKRYRYDPTGIQVDNFDSSLFMDNAIQAVNTDSGIILLTNRANQIICWDGISFTNRGQFQNEKYYHISGIFLHEKGLEVFVNSDYSIKRILVNDTTNTVAKIPSDSLQIVMIAEKWNAFLGTGLIKGGNDWYWVLFTISKSDSLRILDTIPGNAHQFIETENAIYLHINDFVYRITSGSIRHANLTPTLSGPLFLDHNGRPTIFYQNTRRIVYIDSLGYHDPKWW